MFFCRDTAPAVSAKHTNTIKNRHNRADFSVSDTPEGCSHGLKQEVFLLAIMSAHGSKQQKPSARTGQTDMAGGND